MTTALVQSSEVTAIEAAGLVANHYAAAGAFADYMGRKAQNTITAQHADLVTFADYLCSATKGAVCPDAKRLQAEPNAWRGVTWGLVAGFVRWMLEQGYSVSSVNRKLSTVKVYVKLAAQSGAVSPTEATLIKAVSGYGSTEGKRIDERRSARKGTRKRSMYQ